MYGVGWGVDLVYSAAVGTEHSDCQHVLQFFGDAEQPLRLVTPAQLDMFTKIDYDDGSFGAGDGVK